MAREAEYKPLLFTTTIRNPQRIKSMLWVLKKFNGLILDNELATKIVGETIRYGLYRPMKKCESIKAKWLNAPMGEFGNELLTDDEVKSIKKQVLNEDIHHDLLLYMILLKN